MSVYVSVAQGSEYVWIWLNNTLWQDSEYAWLTFHSCKYAWAQNMVRFWMNTRGLHRVLNMSNWSWICLKPIQDGHFGAAHGRRGAKKAPFPKICHTYPTMLKLGTVIPDLKKITPSDFCWHQHFFTENQQILLYQEIQI